MGAAVPRRYEPGARARPRSHGGLGAADRVGSHGRRLALRAVALRRRRPRAGQLAHGDRKSTRLNSSHGYISYAVFCLQKKKRAFLLRGGLIPEVQREFTTESKSPP